MSCVDGRNGEFLSRDQIFNMTTRPATPRMKPANMRPTSQPNSKSHTTNSYPIRQTSSTRARIERLRGENLILKNDFQTSRKMFAEEQAISHHQSIQFQLVLEDNRIFKQKLGSSNLKLHRNRREFMSSLCAYLITPTEIL